MSPSKQRGRDFAIILKSLSDLGYVVEWRVINAADYGMPQRRKRVFILAYLEKSTIFKQLKKTLALDWLISKGTLASALPVYSDNFSRQNVFNLEDDIVNISSSFNSLGGASLFENCGLMVNGSVTTLKTVPKIEGKPICLGDVLQNGEVTEDFYINENDIKKWHYLKGPKKEVRKNASGFEYNYSEGGMHFPDPLNKPSRTIITGEGGPSPSRFKHVVLTEKGYRRLSPVELERLNMFPDNHTELEGVTNTKRAFFMGNALVVGVVEKIGLALKEKLKMPQNYNRLDKASVLSFAKKIKDKSLREVCDESILEHNYSGKGNFGQILEKYYFQYEPNSDSEADFSEINLELKATPLKQLKNRHYRSKERLVLNIINYLEIVDQDFVNSTFWKKNSNLLLIFYLHNFSQDILDYVIKLVDEWNFPKNDLEIIKGIGKNKEENS
ncbi:MutH/Sau3AI family endonuclease [Candidatus Brachybacter algidus]|uniref:MutH/Sau3AI family endonuclease n=1 Tax=Candidatus Brachybacter algidus TaxID=2982024 RepID=UPI00257BAFFC|nr:MutH/Sau3AI family endonuclease [Candidatus Brachybacter algidus]